MLRAFWKLRNPMPKTLQNAALDVLMATKPELKCLAAHAVYKNWQTGGLCIGTPQISDIPDEPGRPDAPMLVAPKFVKRRRLGSRTGRIALLHAIAHIEFNAINLAADMLARFSGDKRLVDEDRHQFVSDWVSVCNDEARHFTLIQNRLLDLGSCYGDLPAHNGLWEAAQATAHDLAARLAIAPMVLEARGLDVTPGMIKKLVSVGDTESADILSIIYSEEIAHVAAGVRWFTYICKRENHVSDLYFKSLLNTYYKGTLKPPFNTQARTEAGLFETLYLS